jgi:hypothetical protein
MVIMGDQHDIRRTGTVVALSRIKRKRSPAPDLPGRYLVTGGQNDHHHEEP